MLITKSSFDKYPNIFLLCNFKLFLFAVHKTKSLHVFDVRVWCNKSSYVARCCLAINRSQTYLESSLIRNINTVKSGPNCNR